MEKHETPSSTASGVKAIAGETIGRVVGVAKDAMQDIPELSDNQVKGLSFIWKIAVCGAAITIARIVTSSNYTLSIRKGDLEVDLNPTKEKAS